MKSWRKQGGRGERCAADPGGAAAGGADEGVPRADGCRVLAAASRRRAAVPARNALAATVVADERARRRHLIRALASHPALLPPAPLLDASHTPNMVAIVQRPAPAFTAAAVVDGLFKDVSLSDYLGQW